MTKEQATAVVEAIADLASEIAIAWAEEIFRGYRPSPSGAPDIKARLVNLLTEES